MQLRIAGSKLLWAQMVISKLNGVRMNYAEHFQAGIECSQFMADYLERFYQPIKKRTVLVRFRKFFQNEYCRKNR